MFGYPYVSGLQAASHCDQRNFTSEYGLGNPKQASQTEPTASAIWPGLIANRSLLRRVFLVPVM